MNYDNLNIYNILSMEDKISNSFNGEFILEKAYKMRTREYLPLTLDLWKNLDPEAQGFWALNSEELWICKLANCQHVNINWVQPQTVIDNAWKMTTETQGKSVKLVVHLDSENKKFIHSEKEMNGHQKEWTIRGNNSNGQYTVFDENNSQIQWSKLIEYFPDNKFRKIKELNADELASYANNIFILMGRNLMMARLIYRCIELEKQHPLGLRSMSDFLDQQGTKAISASIMEYIIRNKIGPTVENQKEHELILLNAKWAWGFCKHKDGLTNPSFEDFQEKNKFVEDSNAYREFLQSVKNSLGENRDLIHQANYLIGCIGGIVSTKSVQQNTLLLAYLNITDFEITNEYHEFLNEDIERLEEVKQRFNQMKRKSSG